MQDSKPRQGRGGRGAADTSRASHWLNALRFWFRPRAHGADAADPETAPVHRPKALTADSVNALFNAARRRARRVEIDSDAVDFLLSKSRWPGVSRRAWEKEVRLNAAIYGIMRRSRSTLAWEQMTDVAAVDAALQRAQSAGPMPGMLLLAYHGPFAPLTQEFFNRRCEAGIIIGGKLVDRTPTGRSRNWGDMLFAALNALRDDGFVFVAPDGWRGQQSAEFTVLGATGKGGGGAAFLAHSSRCKTAWFTFNRDGHRFIPVVELGPAPLDGEKLAAFSARLHEFYEKKIEEVFTGDPRNIDVTGRWGRAFAAMANAKDKDKAKA